jgi:hypothetical protein
MVVLGKRRGAGGGGGGEEGGRWWRWERGGGQVMVVGEKRGEGLGGGSEERVGGGCGRDEGCRSGCMAAVPAFCFSITLSSD